MALAKLRQPRSCLRLLTLKSDYRLLWRALFGAPRTAARRPAAAPAAAAPAAAADNTNPLFAPALAAALDRGCRALLVFSGSDRLYSEFQEKYVARHGAVLQAHAGRVEVQVVPDANHIFTFSAWQRDMLDRCDRWLTRTYPAAEPVSTAAAAVSEAATW
jgi:hypothetical protein